VKKPFYKVLYVQVLIAIAVGIALGHFYPALATDMKPLGDGFIKLIKMVIGPIIFCTVVTGIAGMEDMKKVGRVGGKALLYFEIVSTFALVLGLAATHILKPGVGFNVDPATLDGKAVASYAAKAHGQTTVDFLMHIIPDTLVSAFAQGEILQILLIALLFGSVLAHLGDKARVVTTFIDGLSHILFGIVRIITKLAPIGAFGAMAFTIGKYGIGSLVPMLKLIGTFYLTSIVFVVVVLGLIARAVGFNILRFIAYIKEEMLIVLGTSSSEAALPQLMLKLEKLGCSRSVVGLVVPTGYSFNLDGTNIYMTLASLIHYGTEFRCGIDVVGISNFLTFLKNTQDYRRDLRRVEYGDEREAKMSEFLARISPTERAKEIRVPLFIVQGKNDPRVPVTEARQMADAVRKAGGTAWYLEASDEGHGFAKKKNADYMFLSMVLFFREFLLN